MSKKFIGTNIIIYGTSFRDALILTAAEHAGGTRILSEDLNAGQVEPGSG